jgi:hypothetical protein
MCGESVVSEIRSGKRNLNAARIEQFGKRLPISPAAFFPNA